MKNKNNKINITLTFFSLLGMCGLANAQQTKSEVKTDSSKQESSIFKYTFSQDKKVEPAKVENKKVEPVKVEDKKVESAKVEDKKVESAKVEDKKVESAKVEDKKVEPAKVEDKKVEPAKVEDKKVEKIVINKSFNERIQLVEKYGKNKGLIVGVFPGSVSTVDTTSYISRYLPFINYLTVSANELISFVPDINVKSLKEKTIKGKYDFLYINAEVATIAVKNGYEPLVQRSEKIVSVILTKKGSAISNVQDLVTAKVGAVPQAMVSTLAQVRFKKENVNVEFISGGLTGQKELILGLDNDVFNAIVVRKETAEDLMSKDADKYKIAVTLEEAPGFILLAKKDVASSVKEGLSKGLLSLNIESANDRLILNGLDGKVTGFSKINLKEIESFENKIKLVN